MKFPSVEIEKRDRDEHTDTLIKSLLDEEKSSKKLKRGSPHLDVGAKTRVPARKGKTFAEIEEEEGGPVKESLVGMAHAKRALDRKKRDVDVGDTELVTNTERYEKDTLDVEQEEGITFEPFNLKQEREEGHFDEDGNYVLWKQEGKDGDDEQDAWLTSDEAMVVCDEVRRKIEQQRARAEEAARRGPLTERQIAQRKADMAAMMRPGETVTRALQRLGSGGAGAAAGSTAASGGGLPHRAMGKRERARLLAQQQQRGVNGAANAAADAAAGEHFARMTELADELLEEGELEIYGATTEELQRSARMWLPHLVVAPAVAGGSSAANATATTGGAGKRVVDDDDEDMFAEEEDDKKKGAGGEPAAAVKLTAAAVDQDQDMFADDDEGGDGGGDGGTGRERVEAVPAGTASGAAATRGRTASGDAGADAGGTRGPDAQGSGTAVGTAALGDGTGASATAPATAAARGGGGGAVIDYGSWPIKELKRLLQERGVDPGMLVEKADLVAKVKEVVDMAGDGAAGGSGGAAFVAPPGYAYDPSSGYFYSEDAGMYYDTNSGAYCQVATGKWFYLDSSSGAFVEWT